MKNVIYILCFCFTSVLQAQNIREQTFLAANLSTITIHAEQMFKVTIETKPVSEITVHSRIEGENNENIIVVAKITNKHLDIAAKEQPVFMDANDKLSAHKVISIALHLVVPENMSVVFNTINSDFIVNGLYKQLHVNSETGNCFLYAFQGDAMVYTRNGNVTLETNYATIDASSKNGFITKENITIGTNEVFIKTINGNVTITKSQ